VDCFVRYDPEVDVATLGFSADHRAGGPAREIRSGTALHGLIRLTEAGAFDHLEVLGASAAIPQFVSGLTAPAHGVRDYRRGRFTVPVVVDADRRSVRITLAAAGEDGELIEVIEVIEVIDVMAEDSGALLARVRRRAGGLLVDVTLFAVGPLVAELIDRVPPTS